MTQLILGQLLNGIIVGSLYGIIALGVTLTFGLTGIVNFALGAFMMLGAYSTWYLYDVNHL
ncbi:branched-chain amino acid ABC transporter permease, partial [Acinetobacter baumannii]